MAPDQTDPVKESFRRVKEDITSLKTEIDDLHNELNEIQSSLLNLIKINLEIQRSTELTKNTKTDRQSDTSTHSSTHQPLNKTNNQDNQTENTLQPDTSTHILPFKPSKDQYIDSSIGNRGVSTDRQTDNQTDTSTHFIAKNPSKNTRDSQIPLIPSNTSMLIEQLDSIKKDLRLKVKRLTTQEMSVFCSVYQFEDQGFLVDYHLLSSKLNISESSIRDYIQRILAKGLPLIKEKVNNKKIILHIPQDFRKLASLDTIIKLREL